MEISSELDLQSVKNSQLRESTPESALKTMLEA
jgi:hypothetical protein